MSSWIKTRSIPTRPRTAHSNTTQSQAAPPLRLQTHNSPSDGPYSYTHHPWSLTPPSAHPSTTSTLPMWLILCTCNFLHSGGWLSSI
ncbi:hypothetical protein RhiirA1_485637 [Rhizophagus irregularis]|uniref:Uncharacterized protein n=1 Tax=Rhizophagus irregularis TaxID=588596 RepID=A0A2N0QI02_9GLOM|nr:hypothetical protein RhiirA1_485637 [Rhizophagus irregularis]